MKRTFFVLVLTIVCSALFSQVNLNRIYYGDFGYVNRTVLQFSKKPEYKVVSNSKNKMITVQVNACGNKSGVDTKSYPDAMMIDKAVIQKNNNDGLNIVIKTNRAFHLKYSILNEKNSFKIVLDIYSGIKPETDEEKASFARFYYKVGLKNKAHRLIRSIPDTKVNYIHYYWGKILLTKRNNSAAIQHFRMVDKKYPEYTDAQEELKKLNALVQPQKQNPRKNTNNTAKQKKVTNVVPVNESVPDIKTLAQKDIMIYDKYQKFFYQTDSDDSKLFIVAVAAKFVKDYDYAVELLKRISEDSSLKKQSYKELAEIYTLKGDIENAKLFRSFLSDSDQDTGVMSESGFMSIEIKLWMALIITIAFGTIVFFLLMIYYNKRISQMTGDFTIDDINYHENLVKDSYNEPIGKWASSEGEKIEDDASEDNMEEEPESEETYSDQEDMDVYNPPIITEKLTPEEEEELLEYEQSKLAEPEEDDSETFANDDYIRKMVVKMSQQDWGIEEIAKELKISQSEVDFILKMQD